MAKTYTTQTNANSGITYTTEHDTENEGSGGCMLLFGFILFVVMIVTTLIYNATGTNVFDVFEGITGPCGTCTTEEPQ